MSEATPSVTVIIAARPEQADILAVHAARQLDYPPDRLDILVARGKQPSAQRNAAVKAARGELIYFLDDDSLPPPDNLRYAVRHFVDPAVKMAGGPSLCPPDAPALEQIFAVVLASWLAFGPSRARYVATGGVRPTSEKELILCNQIVRRDAMLEMGGFNEALYPNEENALMDELQKRGGRLIYDPQVIVYRRPRRTLKAFVKMLLTYGRGRAEQFRVNPTFGSALNFVPPLFCLYLIALPLVEVVQWASGSWIPKFAPVPLGLYVVAVLLQTLTAVPLRGIARSVLAMPLVAVSPVIYGLGFWRGLFTRLKAPDERPNSSVVLEPVAR